MESVAHLKPGTEIATYRVQEKLREGGMSVLYRVAPIAGGEAGLLKVPKLEFGSHPACYAGFEVEQMILGRIGGPHVPRLFASGESEFGPYLVMEHIAGTSLAEYASRAPLPAQDHVRRFQVMVHDFLSMQVVQCRCQGCAESRHFLHR
jgi:serine/threonine protein kinase